MTIITMITITITITIIIVTIITITMITDMPTCIVKHQTFCK